jgi:mannitol-specific phosphotransferase system IIBC component
VGSTFGGTISSIGSPGATPSVPTSEPTSSPIGMIVGVCLGSVAFVFATSLVVFYKRSAKTTVVIQNPVAKTREWETRNEDDRIKFAPEMIRDRIHV